MNVLKIATAGSVDDGKSTLIGRLLYDTKSLTEDKLSSIASSSKKKGYDYLDFSLATDGLVAEREQGITIDVAHIYFSTPNRSYIIADTPGHIEYTRNMVTGASNATVSIILIDARKGVIEQTNRHFFINNLLRVEHIIFAVNKMDLVDYSSQRFAEIASEINNLVKKSNYRSNQITIIPISALNGDNVTEKSRNLSWYPGKPLLAYLEDFEVNNASLKENTRFPIQSVVRPKTEEYHDFRGFSGKLYGNDLSVGDSITVLPSGTESRVKSIHFFDETFDKAEAGSSITLTLEDEVNVNRGDMIVKSSELPTIEKELSATVCWMDKEPLTASTKYLIQRGVQSVAGKILAINEVFQPDFSGLNPNPDNLQLNDIGSVSLKLSKPLIFDPYEENKSTGTFILINPNSNTTAGVGFIR